MFKLVIWVCQEVAKVAVEIKALIHMGSTLAHTAKAVDWVWQVGQVAVGHLQVPQVVGDR